MRAPDGAVATFPLKTEDGGESLVLHVIGGKLMVQVGDDESGEGFSALGIEALESLASAASAAVDFARKEWL